MTCVQLNLCVRIRRLLGGRDNLFGGRLLGCFCALLFFGYTWRNWARVMGQNVSEGCSRTEDILLGTFRVVYIKLTYFLLYVLFSWNRHNILTDCLLGFIFSCHFIHVFTNCILRVISWNFIYINVAVCLLDVIFRSQWLHISTNWLLGGISCQSLQILTACLLVVLFTMQFLHILLTACLLGVLSWKCLCNIFTVCLLGFFLKSQCLHSLLYASFLCTILQSQCLHIHLTNFLLVALNIFTRHCLYDIGALLFSIIFVCKNHHCLTACLVCICLYWSSWEECISGIYCLLRWKLWPLLTLLSCDLEPKIR